MSRSVDMPYRRSKNGTTDVSRKARSTSRANPDDVNRECCRPTWESRSAETEQDNFHSRALTLSRVKACLRSRVSPLTRHNFLADAKRAHPAVFALLLECDAAIEYWAHGRLHVATAAAAPSPDTVLARAMHAHRRRFHCLPDGTANNMDETGVTAGSEGEGIVPPGDAPARAARTGIGDTAPLAALVSPSGSDPAALRAWLTRAGRFMNTTTTNSLGVTDDARALALFLRDRAQRSSHTLRAYRTEVRRLIGWCEAHRRGPLSDLTRDDLLAFRHTLGPAGSSGGATSAVPSRPNPARVGKPSRSDASRRRALAVISSLFHYWQKTGYLIINPAAELSGGGAARMTWTPARILPARVLALCDSVTAGTRPPGVSALVWARRCAIWSLYRFAGVRLAELEWSAEQGLPRLSVEPAATTTAGPAHASSGATGGSGRCTCAARAAGSARSRCRHAVRPCCVTIACCAVCPPNPRRSSRCRWFTARSATRLATVVSTMK